MTPPGISNGKGMFDRIIAGSLQCDIDVGVVQVVDCFPNDVVVRRAALTIGMMTAITDSRRLKATIYPVV